MNRKPRRPVVVLIFSVLISLATLAFSAIVLWTAHAVRIPGSGSRQTTIFYAAPTDLSPGSRLDPVDLMERLERLGYESAISTAAPGTFRQDGDTVEIHLRPFRYPDRESAGGRLILNLLAGKVESARALDPIAHEDYLLEPERIAAYEGDTGALLSHLRLEDADPLLLSTLIAVEDRRFWRHPGVDPVGSLRALSVNLRHGQMRQGGSTLTQQIARSLFLRNDRTILRKVREVVLALALEIRYSKREILEAYLNGVYWGNWGPKEIRGIREASRYYLHAEIEEVDLSGFALLTGLLRAPNVYSPYSSPRAARDRRDQVVSILVRDRIITIAQADSAKARRLPWRLPPDRLEDASYFLDAARREISKRAPRGILDQPNVKVFTTLDTRDQAASVLSLREGLLDLRDSHPNLRKTRETLQGAIVVLNPVRGEVRALVGGKDYIASSFNRATEAHRQPGSLFKPIVYLAAFKQGRRADGTQWSPLTSLRDEPTTIKYGRERWRPENYDGDFRGAVTLRFALEQSINVPAAIVADEIGIENVVDTAHELGIDLPLAAVPSLSLGSSEVTLLEMANVYATLANGGTAHQPTFIRAVLDGRGVPVDLAPFQDPPGTSPQNAYMMTSLLMGVIDNRGTGHRARSLGVVGEVAGKTGTTDDYRDAWFIGYSPRRVTAVWVGFDRGESLKLTGATAALPIWAAVMRQTLIPFGGDGSFPIPSGMVVVSIDPTSGQLANRGCPETRSEVFFRGTEPTRKCQNHPGDSPSRRAKESRTARISGRR